MARSLKTAQKYSQSFSPRGCYVEGSIKHRDFRQISYYPGKDTRRALRLMTNGNSSANGLRSIERSQF